MEAADKERVLSSAIGLLGDMGQRHFISPAGAFLRWDLLSLDVCVAPNVCWVLTLIVGATKIILIVWLDKKKRVV